jgi:hypothetical protein
MHAALCVEIVVVTPDNMSEAQRISANQLIKTIQDIDGKTVQRLSAETAGRLIGNDLVLLALGRDTVSTILGGNGNLPVIATYVSEGSFNEILEARPKKNQRELTAIYSGADPMRALALAKILLGENKTCFTVMSGHTEQVLTRLSAFANKIGMYLQFLPARSNTTERDILRDVSNNGVILIDKDSVINSQIDIGRLLLGSYQQHHIGVIGFGDNFTAAGGLGSTSSTTNDLVDDLMFTLANFQASARLAPPHYTRKFNVHINPQLTRTLNLSIHSEAEATIAITQLIGSNTHLDKASGQP